MNIHEIFSKMPPRKPNEGEKEIAKALVDKWIMEIFERILNEKTRNI